jgi:dehydrogenase/reductase SDR family protein 12
LFLLSLFIVFGFSNDYSLIYFKLITKESYQYGNISLWIIFLIYYEKVFEHLKTLPFLFISFLGGAGGAITYWSAAKFGAIMIIPGKEAAFFASQFTFWAIFFPASLRMYFNDSYWDYFLDKTILFSFDQSGYLRHEKKFTEELSEKNLLNRSVLITGGTSGIGAAVASFLSDLGATVYLTGRNLQKGLDFEEKNKLSKFISLDMANWQKVYDFARSTEVLNLVVFNAGSMPEDLKLNENGVELQCASQLLGHYYLLLWLKEFKKIIPGSRIVWVSSGGMYLKKLDIESLFNNFKYDKVETYANVKRAQVTLVEELAKKEEWQDFLICSIHPGWVATDGLKDALPTFYHVMKKRLRSPKEGADTILWCLLTDLAPKAGGFYFDRKKVTPYLSPKYFPSEEERLELLIEMNKIKPDYVE